MQRRQFALALMSAIACPAIGLPQPCSASAPSLHILVLGGTDFLGPAIVDALLAAGHRVTLFNRGVTNPDLFPHLEKLRGYRSGAPDDEDLSALSTRRFDVAIDVWPSDPAIVQTAAAHLRDRVGRYFYVSSVAAYERAALNRSGVTEEARLAPWIASSHSYNRGKAESERRLAAIFEDRLTVVRPGPIKGDRDTATDLFAWLMRAQAGGEHIGPGDGDDPIELVDVKDVARFLLLAIDHRLTGPFNLTGRPLTFRTFLAACNAATDSDARFIWIPQQFLLDQGLKTDAALGTFAGNFPFWRPKGDMPELWQISSEKAYGAGWRTRAFQETAYDYLRFHRGRSETPEWEDYLPASKEQAVLAAWAKQR